MRTSKTTIIFRLTVVGVAITALPVFVLGGITLGAFLGYCALFFVVAYVFWTVISGACTFLCWLTMHDDPGYQELRRRGFRPYWDTMPWPFNRDSQEVRIGPEPEPDYGSYGVPPPGWQARCNACGARNQVASGSCWFCGWVFPGTPTTGRAANCWQCGGEFVEINFGDLDRGVLCPHCGANNVAAQ